MLLNTFYIYKDVSNTKGRYRAYIDGRIYDKLKNKFLEPRIDKAGYCNTYIVYENKKGTNLWHRIIAQTFIPNPNNKPQINHKDANKENNCVDNLEWVTSQENMTHVSKNGLYPKSKACCIVEDDEVIKIFKTGRILAREMGIDNRSIVYSCEGGAIDSNGVTVRYYDEENQDWVRTRFDDENFKFKSTRKYKILCNENMKIYNSQMEAGRDLNISQPKISNHLNGLINDVDGYTFTLIERHGAKVIK